MSQDSRFFSLVVRFCSRTVTSAQFDLSLQAKPSLYYCEPNGYKYSKLLWVFLSVMMETSYLWVSIHFSIRSWFLWGWSYHAKFKVIIELFLQFFLTDHFNDIQDQTITICFCFILLLKYQSSFMKNNVHLISVLLTTIIKLTLFTNHEIQSWRNVDHVYSSTKSRILLQMISSTVL